MIRVVAAAIENAHGDILLAQRPAHKHKGGLWEFPGGKVEAGESDGAALVRELQEELNITATHFAPLITLVHHYPEKSIELVVFRVRAYEGQLCANEQQPLVWVAPDRMSDYAMPEADVAIINALRLPPFIAITPRMSDDDSFYRACARTLAAHPCFLQLRDHTLCDASYRAIASTLLDRYPVDRSRVLLNRDPAQTLGLCCAGHHLTRHALTQLTSQQVTTYRQRGWLSVSCHAADELALASNLGFDFVLLSPVQPTASHPERLPLGWRGFQSLRRGLPLPVYALGGLHVADLTTAYDCGAQGIAGISGLWRA